MRKSSKIFWGIILVVAACALILFATVPEFTIGISIPAWKILLCALIIFDIIKHIITEEKISDKLSIFIHLALLFIILEKHIAEFYSLPADFVNNWYIIGAAVLLTIAVSLIFGGRRVHASKTNNNRLSSAVVYIDSTDPSNQEIRNTLGETNVFFQNTDIASVNDPINLHVTNKLGETNIHVPESWTVDMKMTVKLGEVSCRPNTTTEGKKLIITGTNELGETNIVSP